MNLLKKNRPESATPPDPSRRNFLRYATVSGAAGVAMAMSPRLATAATPPADARNWSDPATWGGSVPNAGTRPVISRPIVLDIDATVAGLEIAPGGELYFDPASTRTLTSTRNVIVRGRLTMRPDSAAVTHSLLFTGISEAAFVGGGMEPVESDVGLWVMDSGNLDIAGTHKLAWTRAAGSINAGQSSIELQADPVGWRVGDEITITPTAPVTARWYTETYDSATITAINGRTVSLSKATTYAHPAVTVAAGTTYTAEVLNLTRNVRIEGTSTGRAHIFIRSTQPQTVRNAGLRYLGPRKPDGSYTAPVLGRYGLHFHHCMDGSRSSLVEGVVGRQIGNRVFVPHMSDGVSFRSCISHDTFEEAYWWDQAADTRTAGHPSNDITFDRCVASLVKFDPAFRGIRLCGFAISAGSGNTATGCVAVGVRGNVDASGYHWPEGSEGVWTFTNNLSHNCNRHGLFTWQNTNNVHVIDGFTAYHNGGAGISHGAYVTPFVFKNCISYGNANGALRLSSVTSPDGNSLLTFKDNLFDAAGVSDYAVWTDKHTLNSPKVTEFRGCTFKGGRRAALALHYAGHDGASAAPELIDVINCTFIGNEFWINGGVKADSVIRVQDQSHGSIRLRRADQPGGTLKAEWNAKVEQIAPFAGADGTAPAPAPSPSATEEPAPEPSPTPTQEPAPEPTPTPTPTPTATATPDAC